MVASLEAELARRKNERWAADGMTEFDRTIVGKPVRIEIPFDDPLALRRVAEKLRAYADELTAWSQRHDVPPRTVLIHLRMEARRLNAEIKRIHGKGGASAESMARYLRDEK